MYVYGTQNRREHIKKLITQLGLMVYQEGSAYRVRGKGIDILTADLANLYEGELMPHKNRGNTLPGT